MVSGLSYGTSLPMFYNQVQRPDIQFRSDLSLAKDVPSTVDIKPRFDIQAMFSKWEMDISATPRYLGYKSPSTDPFGNLYYADTADVRHDLPRESIRLVNRLRVDNTFVVQRFRYEVITGSEYGSTWVPFSSGVGLNSSNDFGLNDVFTRQPPEPYVPTTGGTTDGVSDSNLVIIVVIIVVGIAIVGVILFVSRKRTTVKTVKK